MTCVLSILQLLGSALGFQHLAQLGAAPIKAGQKFETSPGDLREGPKEACFCLVDRRTQNTIP
jgi:hypothetical protein